MRKLVENIAVFIQANKLEGKIRLAIAGLAPKGLILEASAACGCEAKWINESREELTEYSKDALLTLAKGHKEAETPPELQELFDFLEDLFDTKKAPEEPVSPVASEEPAKAVDPAPESDEGQSLKFMAGQLNRLLGALDCDPSMAEQVGVEALVDHALAHVQYLYEELNDLRKAEAEASEKVRAARKLLKGL